MPEILIHLRVGYEVNKKYKAKNEEQYYLGCILPDAVNAYGFASKEKRWNSHKRDKDLNKWENNIIEFYKENIEKYPKDYLKGYLVHVLTDVIADKFYYKYLKEKISKDKYIKDIYGFYKNELQLYEHSQIKEQWFLETINTLKKAEIIPIENIKKDEILLWREYNIRKYSLYERKIHGIITPKYLEKITSEVVGIIDKNNIQ